ncbi:sulfite reductase subunit alpha [Luteimonas terricola]|uniref:NADPH--hemoprotein reductase n=1 Tax=Luteimonas terricola TaxID=645597 RepID=A0ABQ2EGT8_9GAMM|nr:sulfite reductase subunit alpha [Luteimonas terricola]
MLQAGILFALCLAALAFIPLHDESWWPGPPSARQGWLAALLLAAYVGASVARLWRTRRGERAQAASDATDARAPEADEWLVIHASQTGQAFELAQRTAESLRAAGLRARLRDIARLDAATLTAARQALFVASTTGEGDPPDPAAAFIRAAMRPDLALPGLRYAVLALGDRSYQNYCAFGHALDQWLRGAGASPLFDLVEVDNGDPAALRHWQHHLGVAAGAPELPDWSPASYAPWTLAARRELNPGSVGGAVHEVRLSPPAGSHPQWRAGDIAEIGPRQAPSAVAALLVATGLDPATQVRVGDARASLRDLLSRSHLPAAEDVQGLDAQALAARLQPLPHREYSIASVPGEGALRLLLRRMLRPDGSPGVGSGWLCDHAPAGGMIDLRTRANPGFRGPATDVPLVLVGNGTGIAGLRAHLAERVAAGGHRSWLLFGERHADRDFHLREDILQWLDDGALARLDLAFSRDGDGAGLPASAATGDNAAMHRGYVQDALRTEAARLRQWVDDGATILVCGSLKGMAPGVDAVLREVLGKERVEELLVAGRYRRDVY